MRQTSALRPLTLAMTMALAALPALAQDENQITGRGFQADKVYQVGDVDDINLFSGGMTMTFPIGSTYSINGFSWGLTLSYNSFVWEYKTYTHETVDYLQGVPSSLNNAGIGWMVSLGELLEPTGQNPENPPHDQTRWIYVSPDGGRHSFYPTLHTEDPETTGFSYTRDSSYLRMHELDENVRTIELPNGEIHTFNYLTDYWLGFGEDGWKLVRMEDRFGNRVELNYYLNQNGPAVSITEFESGSQTPMRSHQIFFGQTTPDPGHPAISEIRLTAPGFGTLNYAFNYLVTMIERGCRDQAHMVPSQTNYVEVPLLTSIQVYQDFDSSNLLAEYRMDDGGALHYDTGCTGGSSGRLTRLLLPTGGAIEWEYGNWYTPAYCEAKFATAPGSPQGAHVPYTWARGVVARTTYDQDGTELGTWRYDTYLVTENGENPSCSTGQPPVTNLPNGTVTTVLYPSGQTGKPNEGHCSRHYFNAYQSNSGAAPSDFGLPFSPNEPTIPPPDDELKLSTQIWETYRDDLGGGQASEPDLDCGLGDPGEEPLRSTYVQYATDSGVEADTNRRLLASRTIFHDDADSWLQMEHDPRLYDGLGHYRTAWTKAGPSGPEPWGDSRKVEVTTNYNPDRGNYPDNWYPFPTDDPWILETFTDVTKQGPWGDRESRELFCFDPASGFLRGHRLLVDDVGSDGWDLSQDDRVEMFLPSGAGNLEYERYYGGHFQTADTGIDLCNPYDPGLPAAPEYEIQHSYANGGRTRSAYLDGGNEFLVTLDQDIDPASGLPSLVRDVSGIETALEYDGLGRLLWSKPDAGHGAWTEYVYDTATETSPAMVAVFQRANGSTGGSLARSEYWYDGFGRVARERRLMPGAVWSNRTYRYNARGWRIWESEWDDDDPPLHGTTLSGHDPFGRPTSIVQADGSAIGMAYTGVRQVARTVKIQLGTAQNVTTLEQYDQNGALFKVYEPSEPGSGARDCSPGADIDDCVVTQYAYDANGRLRFATSDRPSSAPSGQQQQEFEYDGMGNLTRYEPAEGGGGPFPIEFFEQDSRGHAHLRTWCHSPLQGGPSCGETGLDGPTGSTLTYDYDAAERLLELHGQIGDDPSSLLKRFTYATQNQGNDLAKGKLRTAERFQAGGSGPAVTETYTYEGIGGRVSQRVTDLALVPMQSFTTGFTWSELGDPASVTYPAGGGEPARTVSYDYTRGWLTSIPGWAPTIQYHPNQMLKRVVHANNVSDIWDADPDSMRRPFRIRAGGTSFDLGVYSYDGAGNITDIGNDSFTYDPVSRLRTAHIAAYQFDQTYNWADPWGNLAEVSGAYQRPATGEQFHYNDFNRLINDDPNGYPFAGEYTQTRALQYVWKSFDSADTPLAAFDYDPLQMVTHAYQRAPSDAACTDEDPPQIATSPLWNDFYAYTADDERIYIRQSPAPPQVSRQVIRIRGLDNKILRELVKTTTIGGGGSFTWSKDFIYRDGLLLAIATNDGTGARHAHLDHLGTPRYFTYSGGSTHHDYMPFGEEIFPPIANDGPLQFTGQERDRGEVVGPGVGFQGELWGSDYMHARFYQAFLGRFLTVDPGGSADPMRPQSWNKWAYARGNPVLRLDPNGEEDFRSDELRALVGAPELAPGLRTLTTVNKREFGLAAGIAAGGEIVVAGPIEAARAEVDPRSLLDKTGPTSANVMGTDVPMALYAHSHTRGKMVRMMPDGTVGTFELAPGSASKEDAVVAQIEGTHIIVAPSEREVLLTIPDTGTGSARGGSVVVLDGEDYDEFVRELQPE